MHAFREEERDIRRSMLYRLVVVSILSSGSLFLLIGVTNAAELERVTVTPYQRLEGILYRFDWKEAVKSPSLTLDHGEIKGCRGISCAPELREVPCAERRQQSVLVVPEGARDADVCSMHFTWRYGAATRSRFRRADSRRSRSSRSSLT